MQTNWFQKIAMYDPKTGWIRHATRTVWVQYISEEIFLLGGDMTLMDFCVSSLSQLPILSLVIYLFTFSWPRNIWPRLHWFLVLHYACLVRIQFHFTPSCWRCLRGIRDSSGLSAGAAINRGICFWSILCNTTDSLFEDRASCSGCQRTFQRLLRDPCYESLVYLRSRL